MATGDVEVPYFRVKRGSYPTIKFDFAELIPDGMAVRGYSVSVVDDEILEHDSASSSTGDTYVLLGVHAIRDGETLVTVSASIGSSDPGPIVESLQARILVEPVEG